MAFEQSRDFRSGAQNSKRFKEQKTKWAYGTRPSPGVRHNLVDPDVLLTGSESQREKVRPVKRLAGTGYHFPSQNVVKPRNSRIAHDLPQSYSRAKCDALAELSDSTNLSLLPDLQPSPNSSRRKMSGSDHFLYSFDRTDTPGKPLSLDIFVKTNPRETERFVEKEYEILDGNGDALKGRKARMNLRKKDIPPSAAAEDPETLEVDGFEMV